MLTIESWIIGDRHMNLTNARTQVYYFPAPTNSVCGIEAPLQEAANTPHFDCVFFCACSPVMVDCSGSLCAGRLLVAVASTRSVRHPIEIEASWMAVNDPLYKEAPMPNITIPEIRLIDGQPVTTSRALAEFFRKQHQHVTQKVEKLDCSEDFLTSNFSLVPFEHNGNTYIEYQITRDGFTFLAMGFTGKRAAQFKEAYINAFNELEQQAKHKISPLPRRFLVAIRRDGTESCHPIPDDAVVARYEEFPEFLKQSGGVSDAVLSEIASVAMRMLADKNKFYRDKLYAS